MKKTAAVVLIMAFCALRGFALREDVAAVADGVTLPLASQSACLMEAETGDVLYEMNADERLEPASVTKVMSMLLICEALDGGTLSLDDVVTASSYAAGMGGSQIWLETGEQMTVDEMLKAMAVVSANDCTVAMAEHLAGSEEIFTVRMNKRAAELGMVNTHFSNCTGLPVAEHYTTARDIAIMTRELLAHPVMQNYTTIWMDSLRGGAMGLTNTNKLIRFYPGANGMKTGYTDSAKYCLSATAKRDGMQLIGVVMKAPSSDTRFADAKKLLDYGFANFAVNKPDVPEMPALRVKGGVRPFVALAAETAPVVVAKGREKLLTAEIYLPEAVSAPVEAGTPVGRIVYTLEGAPVKEIAVTAAEDVKRMGFGDLIKKIARTTAILA